MKFQVYIGIAIRIIILCCIGMAATYIPEHLREFFGDTPCTSDCMGVVDEEWNWGVRHYWFYWMMFLLFILSLISAGMGIYKLLDNNYEL